MTRKTPSTGQRASRAAVDRLESLQRAGVTHVKKRPPKRADSVKESSTEGAVRPAAKSSAKSLLGDHQPPPSQAGEGGRATQRSSAEQEERAAALAEVQRTVAKCARCTELAKARTQTVFGDGNPSARLAFLGEAPGADEDRMGIPFVGRAGKLLTDIIEKGMQIRRSDVYILNILRCRPPGNRNPLPLEAANCREYLDRQLEIIQPEFICCLGSVAAQNLLDTAESIGRLRGRFFQYGGAKVMCTYHPAYVLRNPAAKRQVWEDIQMLMAEMGKGSE